MKNFRKIIIFVFLVSALVPLITRADILPPPTAEQTFSAYLVVFLINLILNSIILGIAYLIFLKNTNVFKFGKFIIHLVIATIGGFLADMIIPVNSLHAIGKYTGAPATLDLGPNSTATIWHFILVLIIIFAINLLISKIYLKTSSKKSIFIGLWMGILTNPLIFYVITFLLKIYSFKLFGIEFFTGIMR